MKKFILTFLFLVSVLIYKPAAAAALDFSKSITIGSGPKTVVEFTDPDCPFCRKASVYFDARNDVTRHVFFYPLPRHPKAKEKVQYILSQNDHASAYHKIMSGKMDSVGTFEGITPKGIKLQVEQYETARAHKISATPTFLINGRIIEGFDLKKIEEALGSK